MQLIVEQFAIMNKEVINTMKIAWIGTGVMGKPMALHLAKKGHEVTVYNRTLSKIEDMKDNCQLSDSIAHCVENADVVFTIVGFPSDVREVYLGNEGILNNVKEETIVVDMTTSSPTLAKEIYLEAKKLNVYSLDAPVTGGDRGAREATLSIMVGGDKDKFDTILELFEVLGNTVTYMGEAGNGQYTKLANQMAIAGSIVGVAEALAFADSKNIALNDVLNVINNGSASSWQGINNGPKMVANDRSAGFFIKHFVKDLRLGQDEKNDLTLNISKAILEEYEQLLEEGYGDFGTQSIIDYYRKAK